MKPRVSIIEITPKMFEKIVELKIPKKFYKYQKSEGILKFTKGFFLSLIFKGSNYLKEKESKGIFEEKEPVALLWHKIQTFLQYEETFETRLIYYRMIINYGQHKPNNSFSKSNNEIIGRTRKKTRRNSQKNVNVRTQVKKPRNKSR